MARRDVRAGDQPRGLLVEPALGVDLALEVAGVFVARVVGSGLATSRWISWQRFRPMSVSS